MYPGCAYQRTQQRRNQRHVCHQRGNFYADRFFKGFLNGGVTHRTNKAQAYPLQKTQESKLLNILCKQGRKAGHDEPEHAG
ncbi:hypothetical protein SDC9_139488 [bioreactor metagenome]|uniref:Uncharacterized protein n=1 Tax=bioreactor metagenome TaxID=1076179 RepID=A0A645DUU3_9ZZZZ